MFGDFAGFFPHLSGNDCVFLACGAPSLTTLEGATKKSAAENLKIIWYLIVFTAAPVKNQR